jgi:hypothetical protein
MKALEKVSGQLRAPAGRFTPEKEHREQIE